tara:strand:- start:165 stop:434 length:270 start_codon:yes stop_codon:yes gene_type:complete
MNSGRKFGTSMKKKMIGKVGQVHHIVPSQFSTLVVDDSHLTTREAKIIRPYAFITGQGLMMKEDYENRQLQKVVDDANDLVKRLLAEEE